MFGTANAQSAFEGFYGQVGIGYENNSIGSYTSSYNNSYFASINSANSGSFAGVIGLGYNHSITKDFLLGIGFDYGVVPSNTFNTPPSSSGANDVYGNKVSNRYNIFITPGYVIDKNQLAYLKAGYSSQSLKITEQSPGYNGETIGNGNVNGYVVGLGYKQMIQSGFYGFAEANYYNYSSASFGSKTINGNEVYSNLNPKSSAYQFLVGVGYKF